MKATRFIAEKMFNAYNEHGPTPWKTFDGRDVPKWEEINEPVREKWVAAADRAILEWVHLTEDMQE